VSTADKKKWWNDRAALDARLACLVQRVQQDWFDAGGEGMRMRAHARVHTHTHKHTLFPTRRAPGHISMLLRRLHEK
jgi:hypothetical protein